MFEVDIEIVGVVSEKNSKKRKKTMIIVLSCVKDKIRKCFQ